jgi:hypothetical protein
MAKGVAGLLHDATRPGRKKPLPAATIEQVDKAASQPRQFAATIAVGVRD